VCEVAPPVAPRPKSSGRQSTQVTANPLRCRDSASGPGGTAFKPCPSTPDRRRDRRRIRGRSVHARPETPTRGSRRLSDEAAKPLQERPLRAAFTRRRTMALVPGRQARNLCASPLLCGPALVHKARPPRTSMLSRRRWVRRDYVAPPQTLRPQQCAGSRVSTGCSQRGITGRLRAPTTCVVGGWHGHRCSIGDSPATTRGRFVR
jgi:hypothetical protein